MIVDGNNKGSTTKFDETVYYSMLGKAFEIKTVIHLRKAIMDSCDSARRIDLMVDEWGAWFDDEPGTIQGHLFQQNTLHDAMVAALTLNVFHWHTDRVKMVGITPVVNVLQVMILTCGEEMVLTPTYHVFYMSRVHQGREYLPTDCNAGMREVGNGCSVAEKSVTASCTGEGEIHLSLMNLDLKENCTLRIKTDRLQPKQVSDVILTADKITDYNDFGQKSRVSNCFFEEFPQKGA